MIPRRPHPPGSVAQKPSLRVVGSRSESPAPKPLPDHAQAASRGIAYTMVYSAICDIIHHDHCMDNDPIEAELKKIAMEMLARSKA